MAKTDIIMPQMGESIAEGTVVKWLKKVGDPVKRDEPLFEISTDKVDAEIPSPATGFLAEIKVPEGTTVAVNTMVGTIAETQAEVGGANGGDGKPAAAAAPVAAAPAAAAPAPAAPAPSPAPAAAAPAPAAAPRAPGQPTQAPAAAVAQMVTATPPEFPSPRGVDSKEELRRLRSTPLVRRMAAENHMEIAGIQGTGISERVTKNDMLAAIEARAAGGGAVAAPAAPAPARPSVAPGAPAAAPAAPSVPLGAPSLAAIAARFPAYNTGDNIRIEPMSIMRKKIAEHMVYSKHTSPHVHTLYEIDCTNMLKTREAVQAEYQRLHGQKLTITPFIVKAVAASLRAVPVINASVDGDNIVYKNDLNIGVAVALDWGLIVPVVKKAQDLSLSGINARLADLANRARNKQLQPDEVQGGTFTITNPGVFGALVGLPVISQPQVAILGVGKIEKRVKVIENDAIAVRSCMFVSLGYDHRIVDGAIADEFLSHFKETLETTDFKAML